MKKSPLSISPEQSVTALAHLAWCALVALRTAQQVGQALSPLSTHAFLLRWLTVAYKQKRFPRSIASEIEGLLTLGRKQGLAASLISRLEYLWTSCAGLVSAQSDLYRLTCVIDYLKAEGWINAVIPDEEWHPASLQAEYAGQSAFLVSSSALSQGFCENGKLQTLISFLVTGNISTVMALLDAQSLSYDVDPLHAGGMMVILLPA